MLNRTLKSALAGSVLVLGVSISTHAGAVLLSLDIAEDNNDCAGYFGGSLKLCDVGFALEEEISPIVVKFDATSSGYTTQINSDKFTSITGNEFSLGNFNNQQKSGSWTYDQDAGDPAIRFWVVKASDDFRLYWVVSDTDKADPSKCNGAAQYTSGCLNAAIAQTGGSWSTSGDIFGERGKEISHISFYDTDGSGPPTGVPEPATVGLLGLGMLAMGAIRRRKTVQG